MHMIVRLGKNQNQSTCCVATTAHDNGGKQIQLSNWIAVNHITICYCHISSLHVK